MCLCLNKYVQVRALFCTADCCARGVSGSRAGYYEKDAEREERYVFVRLTRGPGARCGVGETAATGATTSAANQRLGVEPK